MVKINKEKDCSLLPTNQEANISNDTYTLNFQQGICFLTHSVLLVTTMVGLNYASCHESNLLI